MDNFEIIKIDVRKLLFFATHMHLIDWKNQPIAVDIYIPINSQSVRHLFVIALLNRKRHFEPKAHEYMDTGDLNLPAYKYQLEQVPISPFFLSIIQSIFLSG